MSFKLTVTNVEFNSGRATVSLLSSSSLTIISHHSPSQLTSVSAKVENPLLLLFICDTGIRFSLNKKNRQIVNILSDKDTFRAIKMLIKTSLDFYVDNSPMFFYNKCLNRTWRSRTSYQQISLQISTTINLYLVNCLSKIRTILWNGKLSNLCKQWKNSSKTSTRHFLISFLACRPPFSYPVSALYELVTRPAITPQQSRFYFLFFCARIFGLHKKYIYIS